MKKIKLTLVAATMMALSGAAVASTSSYGYLTDTRGGVVKSATSGLCVKTSAYNKDTTRSPDCDKVEVAPAPAVVEEKKTFTQRVQKQFVTEVYFDFNKSQLSLEDKLKLDRLVEEVKNYPRLNVQNVIVLGHADPIGPERRNLPLSQNRADVVADYLAGKLPLITTYALGSEKSVGDCGKTATPKNISCNAENRRAKIVVNAIADVVVTK